MRNKTADIQAIQAQIDALSGVEGQEAAAERARLQASLNEKQEDLNDSIIDRQFEMSKDSLDDLKDLLQDEFDDKWDNIWSNLDDVKELMENANKLTSSQASAVTSALNQILSFYGINTVSTGLDSYVGYASGTKSVDKDKTAWIDENGREIIVRKSDGAILYPMKQGDGVIPNGLTENLFEWGKQNPQAFERSLAGKIPSVPVGAKSNQSILNVQFDGNMLNVEGNITENEIPKLKEFLQQSYEYTIGEISKDARKLGIKV